MLTILSKRLLFFVVFSLCFCYLIIAFYEPQIKSRLSFEPPLLNAVPAGEIVQNVDLIQRVERSALVPGVGVFERDIVCVEVMLANYGNRNNKGVFFMELALDSVIVTQQVDAAIVRDNVNHKVCFTSLSAAALLEAQNITIALRGSSSPSGAAVTAWTTTDLRAGELLDGPGLLSGRSLVYSFSTQALPVYVPIQAWIFLLLGLLATWTLFIPTSYGISRNT